MGSGRKGKRAKEEEEVMEGIASIALLPCGSISGHFIRLPESICYGLHGTGWTRMGWTRPDSKSAIVADFGSELRSEREKTTPSPIHRVWICNGLTDLRSLSRSRLFKAGDPSE